MDWRRELMGGLSSGIDINNYLTIEALENGLTVSLSTNACQYCVDGDGNWKSLAANTATEAINNGQTLSFRGELSPAKNVGIGTFTISKKCNLLGNCMSMLFGDNAANNYSLSSKTYAFYKLFYGCSNIVNVSENFLPATTLSRSCYEYMFFNCSGLVNSPKLPAKTLMNYCYQLMFCGCSSLMHASDLSATTLAEYCYASMFARCASLTASPVLSATTLKQRCYSNMFYKCTSLTTAPALPATTLATSCYLSMFEGCTNLTTAPELPATTLSDECYENMFKGCTSLVDAPELPATTLAWMCYYYMFSGCTNLVNAPELPATTVEGYCYCNMFYDCTSLVNAPTLPATTLVDSCYYSMFSGCTKLNYIKMLATDISASNCLNDWVNGVASSGTFVKHPDMTTLLTGASGIPRGWTVINDGEESGLTFPVTLVEGDNGQLGIDLFNYLIDKYDEQVSFNERSITEQITINSTAGSYYNGDVINILTQINSIQETPTWIRMATQSILNQGASWFSCDYFILYNNGYLEYYSD